ncbi:MAG: hypothetical protein WAV18_25025 [Roseiarcus sp.]
MGYFTAPLARQDQQADDITKYLTIPGGVPDCFQFCVCEYAVSGGMFGELHAFHGTGGNVVPTHVEFEESPTNGDGVRALGRLVDEVVGDAGNLAMGDAV